MEANSRGSRTPGWDNDFVGKGTPSDVVKKLWRKACCKQVDVSTNDERVRKVWYRLDGADSLKTFARKFIANPTIASWLKSKS